MGAAWVCEAQGFGGVKEQDRAGRTVCRRTVTGFSGLL